MYDDQEPSRPSFDDIAAEVGAGTLSTSRPKKPRPSFDDIAREVGAASPSRPADTPPPKNPPSVLDFRGPTEAEKAVDRAMIATGAVAPPPQAKSVLRPRTGRVTAGVFGQVPVEQPSLLERQQTQQATLASLPDFAEPQIVTKEDRAVASGRFLDALAGDKLAKEAASRAAIEEEKKRAPGGVREVVNRFVRGATDVSTSTIKGIGALSGPVAAEAGARGMRPAEDAAKEYFPTDPTKQGSANPLNPNFWTVSLPQGAGSMVPFALTGGLAARVGVAPRLASAMLGASSNASQTYDAAKASGADENRARLASAIGALIGTTEAAGSSGSVGEAVHGGLRKFLTEIGQEGGQEAAQQLLDNINAKVVSGFDPHRAISDGVLESGVVGAALGGGMAAPHLALEARTNRQTGARAVAAEPLAPMGLTPTVAPGTVTERVPLNRGAVTSPVAQSPVSSAAQPQAATQPSTSQQPSVAQPQAAPSLLFPEAQAPKAIEDISSLPPAERVAKLLERVQQTREGKTNATIEQQLNKDFGDASGLLDAAETNWDADRPTAELYAEQGIKKLKGSLQNLQTSPGYQAELTAAAQGQPLPVTPYTSAVQAINQRLARADALVNRDAEIERQQQEAAKQQKKAEKEQAKQARIQTREELARQREIAVEERKSQLAAERAAAAEGRRQKQEAAKTARRAELEQIRARGNDERGRKVADAELQRMASHDAALKAADEAGQRSQQFHAEGRTAEAVNELVVQQNQIRDAVKFLPRTPEAQNTKADLNRYSGQVGNRIGDLRRESRGQRGGPVTEAIPPLFRSDAVVNPEGGVPAAQSFYTPGASFERLAANQKEASNDQPSLLTAIRQMGGIADDGDTSGELRRLGVKESGTTGIVRRNGHSPDRMREMLAEEGLLPQDSTVDDLFQAIEGEMRAGQKPGRKEESFDEFYQRQAQEERETGRRGDGVKDASNETAKSDIADSRPSFDEIAAEASAETAQKSRSFESIVDENADGVDEDDAAAYRRAIDRSFAENPRDYSERTRPGEAGSGTKSLSGFNIMLSRNGEKIARLREMNLNSPEAKQIIAEIRDDNGKMAVEYNRRHLTPHLNELLTMIMSDQFTALAEEDGGLHQQITEEARKLPAEDREDVEREVAAIDVAFDDADMLDLLDRAADSDDNAANDFIELATEYYGLQQETAEGLVRIRRAERARRKAESRRPAQTKSQNGSAASSVGASTAASERSLEPLYDILSANPATIPDAKFDAYLRSLEDWRNENILTTDYGGVDLTDSLSRDLRKQLSATNEERRYRVKNGRLPSKHTPLPIPTPEHRAERRKLIEATKHLSPEQRAEALIDLRQRQRESGESAAPLSKEKLGEKMRDQIARQSAPPVSVFPYGKGQHEVYVGDTSVGVFATEEKARAHADKVAASPELISGLQDEADSAWRRVDLDYIRWEKVSWPPAKKGTYHLMGHDVRGAALFASDDVASAELAGKIGEDAARQILASSDSKGRIENPNSSEVAILSHPDPGLDGKPILGKTGDGRVIVANPDNQTGISKVKDRGVEASTEKPKSERIQAAEKIADHLAQGSSFKTISDARRFVGDIIGKRVLPGSIEAKQADEAIEAGAVLRARAIVADGQSPQQAYRELLALQEQLPTLGTRTSTSMREQAYSTPLPLAYVAAKLAGIDSGTTVYEPSAGHGALLLTADPAKVTANELNADRAGALRDILPGAEITEGDATESAPKGNADAVIANPPFGVVRDNTGKSVQYQVTNQYKTNEIDHAIALKALEALKPNGRAVLIVGSVRAEEGQAARSNGYNGKAKRDFYFTLYNEYNVRDHFTVSGDLYAKQGAGWPVDVIVIDGKGKSSRDLPAADVPRVVKTWDDLGKELNNAPSANQSQTVAKTTPSDVRMGERGLPDGQRDQRSGKRAADDADIPGVPARQSGEDAARGDVGARSSGISERPASASQPAGRSAEPERPGRGAEPHDLQQPEAARPAERPGRVPGQDDAEPQQSESRANRRRDQPGSVDQRTDRGAGRASDVGSVFDEEFDNLFGTETSQQPAKLNESPANVRETKNAPPFKEAAKSAAKESIKGLGDIAKGLDALFNDKNRLGSGPSFDEETYAKAKPYFESAVEHFKNATTDVREVVRRLLTELKGTHNFTVETIQKMKPYVVRFVEEFQESAVRNPQSSQTALADSDTHRVYQPTSKQPSIGTLVPVNMATAVEKSLAQLHSEVGDFDGYIAGKLGYEPEQIGKYFAGEQVDALALAIRNIENGGGFIIGDQTGIGKGRVVAGVIRYAIKNGLTPIFVTEKPTLYGDMVRDLNDIGSGDVKPLITNAGESVPLDDEALDWHGEAEKARLAGQPVSRKRGKFLSTQGKEAHNAILSRAANSGKLGNHNVVFTTYNQMQTVKGQFSPRHDLLRRLANGGVVIFDESHNAGGGAKPETDDKGDVKFDRAQFARQMARDAKGVFYSSATFAKRPEVMDMYFRTALGKAVADLAELSEITKKGGVPMQQVIASMLAESGQYIRRERSFEGVEYAPTPVKVNRKAAEDVSKAMRLVAAFDLIKQDAVKTMAEQVKKEAKTITGDGSIGQAGVQSTNFTSLMHNLIDQMLLGLKADTAAQTAIDALDRGEKPVITVANTMGAFIQQFAEDNELQPGAPVNLTFNQLLDRYLERSREITVGKPYGERHREYLSDEALGAAGVRSYNEAKKFINSINLDIPLSPIDWMHKRLREAGYRTGEITGRGHTLKYSNDGAEYARRPSSETSTAAKKRTISAFNNGTLDVVILNQSGSTGISLHASEKFKDQRRRHMIIAQAEKNIDTHMQMLGRVHRTGQVIAPRYTQMVADIPAELRPAAVLGKKMASLNANTTASRSSAVTSKDTPDFLNKYGDDVAATLMESNPDLHTLLGRPLKDAERGEGLEREDAMRKVTGRIPLLPIAEQEKVYEQLIEEYDDAIQQADQMGENALEAKTLNLDAETLKSEVVVPGSGDGTFERPAVIEKIKAKRQGKPFASTEVLEKLRASLDAGESDSLQNLQQAGKQKMKALGAQLDADVAAFKNHVEEEHGGTKRADIDKQAADKWFAKWKQLVMGGVYPGGTVQLSGDSGLMHGIVLSVEKKGRNANPAALGGWRATIALADAKRQMSAPFSRLDPANAGDEDLAGRVRVAWSPDASTFDAEKGQMVQVPTLEAFDKGFSSSRETRHVVTGNLISGFAALPKGQIVNFTDNQGGVRQGILMPSGFDAGDAVGKQKPVFKTAEQANRFLDEGRSGATELQDREGNLTIRPAVTGGYVVQTPKAKARGGKYYLNSRILDIANGKEFVSVGSRMEMQVSRDQARRIIEAVYKGEGMASPVVLQAHGDQDAARGIVGLPPVEKKDSPVKRFLKEEGGSASLGLGIPQLGKKIASGFSVGELKPRTREDVENSPQFKRWFSGSKVVDDAGKPMALYHGTQSATEISEVDPAKFATDSHFGPGFYMAESPEVAGSGYAMGHLHPRGPSVQGQPHVYKLYASIAKPLDVDAKADPAMIKAAFGRADADLEEMGFSSPTNGQMYQQLSRRLGDDKRASSQQLQEMGYDGITRLNRASDDAPAHREWVAFNPKQIKSATGNNGEFSTETGSILGAFPGNLQGLSAANQPKTTPLREILAGHKPLQTDPYQIQDQALDAIYKAGIEGTLPGARAAYWAGKLKSKKGTDRVANFQANFIESTLDKTNKLIEASEAMAQAKRGGLEYEAAKKKIERLSLQIANAISRMGEYTHPAAYAAKTYKTSLLSAPHIHTFNLLEQVFKFPMHEAQRIIDFAVPAKVFQKWGIPYENGITDFRDLVPAIESEVRGMAKGLVRSPRDIADMIYYGVTRQMLAAEHADGENPGGTDKFELGHRAKMVPGLDQVVNFVGRTHGAADIAFGNMLNATLIAAQANTIARKAGKAHGLSEKEIRDLARDMAHEPSAAMVTLASDATERFKLDYPTLAYDALQALRNLPVEKIGGRHVGEAYKAALDFVVPFSKIPLAAVDTYLFRYSPVGLARTAGRLVTAKSRAGSDNPATGRFTGDLAAKRHAEDTAELFRQGVVGTLAWALMGALGSFGYISFQGGREDDDDRRNVSNVKEILGQDYKQEMVVGDTAYNLHRMGPLGEATAVGSRMYQAGLARRNPLTGEPEDSAKRAGRVAKAGKEAIIFNNPLGNAAKDIAGDDSHSSMIGNYLGGKARGFVPGALRDIAKIQNPTKVVPDDSSLGARLKAGVQSGMPFDAGFGKRADMAPRLDAMGNPVEDPNPFKFARPVKRNPQMEEMLKLGVGVGKPKRESGTPAAEYNDQIRSRAAETRAALDRIAADSDQSGRSDVAKARVYSKELSPASMERAGKLSPETIKAERAIEALRADSYEALRSDSAYQKMSDRQKAEARKRLDENLKGYRGRAASTRSRERAAAVPGYSPQELARMAISAP